jgi:hypothetical protein
VIGSPYATEHNKEFLVKRDRLTKENLENRAQSKDSQLQNIAAKSNDVECLSNDFSQYAIHNLTCAAKTYGSVYVDKWKYKIDAQGNATASILKALDYEVDNSDNNYAQRSWDVTADSDDLLYYMKPEITSIEGGIDMPTQGGSVITIKGKDFGELGLDNSVLSVEYGPQPDSCACSCPWRTVKDAEYCNNVAGCVQTDQTLPKVSYRALLVKEERTRECMSETAEQESGERLLECSSDPLSAYEAKECKISRLFFCAHDCVVTKAHEEIQCNSSIGIGPEQVWRAYVGFNKVGSFDQPGQLSSETCTPQPEAEPPVFCTTNYAMPSITNLTGPILDTDEPPWAFDTRGGESITLVGSNFGVASYDFKGCFGEATDDAMALTLGSYGGEQHNKYKGANCRVSKAHTEVTCETAIGTGKNHQWITTIGHQDSSPFLYNHQNRTMRYKRPVIYKVFGPGVDGGNTRGMETVFIGGNYFGPVTDEASGVASFSYGTWPLSWLVKGVQIENVHKKDVWGYEDDGIQYVDDTGLVNYTHRLASGVMVEGNVEELGPYFRHCEVMTAHTLMRCFTVPGTGTNQTLIATIDYQHSDLANSALRYGKPIIFDIKDAFGVALDKASTKGIDLAIVSGRNFGQVNNLRADIFAYYKHQPEIFRGINCTVREEHEVMECMLSEGVGQRQSWEISIDEQNSTSPTSSYEIPIITSIEGPGAVNADGNGGQWVLISGENFGPIDFHNRPSGFLERVTFGEQGDEYLVCALDSTYRRCQSKCVTEICKEEGDSFWGNHKEIVEGTRTSGCTHLGHNMINCTTVPAIGKKVYWQITVGRQQNELKEDWKGGQVRSDSNDIEEAKPWQR